MNTPDTKKNIALYNNQALDSYADTIISFEYSRYNPLQDPTGGFAVVFFNNIIDMPRDGGPGQSLGYTSSSVTSDTCRLDGYRGLQGAILGIGFDSSGKFALETDTVNGIALSALKPQPTIAVRDNIRNNYSLLYNLADNKTIQDIPGLSNFTIDAQIPQDEESNYRAVRIIVSKQFSEITVQLKENIKDPVFTTVFVLNLPDISRTSYKVALTNTTEDSSTKFLVRNFNIAGFPGVVQTGNLISECNQVIRQENYVPDSQLAMGQEFITFPVGTKIKNYTTDLNIYKLENTIYTGAGIKLLGQDENTVLGALAGSNEVVVLEYLGQKLVKVGSILTPDGAYPAAADIDGNTLVICTQANETIGTPGGIFIYNYIDSGPSPAILGTWNLFQTILPAFVLSGVGLGNSVGLNGNNLIVGNSNQFVHAFQRDTTNVWNYLQTITSPVSGVSRFGSSLSVLGRDLVIGAPYAQKTSFPTLGQGEAFHYFLSSESNTWNLIMPLGEFYAIDSIAGNFGTSVQLFNNTCVIGSPCEAYQLVDNPYETVNVGRMYIFNKTTDGIFTQGTVLAPPSGIVERNMFFGQSVAGYGNFVAGLATYDSRYSKSYLLVYNLDCLFSAPPVHVPVPECAIGIIDRSGYVIDLENYTYMLNLSCLLNP